MPASPSPPRARGTFVSAASVAAFLLLWEGACRAGLVSPLFASAPSAVARTGARLLASGELAADLAATLGAFLAAFAVATGAGVLLGLLVGASRTAYDVLNPFLVGVNALPKIALMPLVVLWFGLGLASRVFLGAVMAGFPIATSTCTGVRCIERDFVLLARAYGASRGRIVRSVLLPAVAPHVLGGMRVGVNYCLVGVLVVEFFASNRGLGYRMVLYSANFQIEPFLALLLVVVAVALAATGLIALAERALGRWRPVVFR